MMKVALLNRSLVEDFITCYRSHPALWNINCDEYKDRSLKSIGWNELLDKLMEYDESLTVDDVKRKINSLRASYRRERCKVKKSKSHGNSVYVSNLWYYKDMEFLNELEDTSDEEEVEVDPLTDRAETSCQSSFPTKRKRRESFVATRKPHLEQVNESHTRDEADIFAEGWAFMYRGLSREQRIFAKRGIDELLMQAQLGRLTYQNVMKFDEFNTADSPVSFSREQFNFSRDSIGSND